MTSFFSCFLRLGHDRPLSSSKQAFEPVRPIKRIGLVLLQLNGLAVITLNFNISGVHAVTGDDTENLIEYYLQVVHRQRGQVPIFIEGALCQQHHRYVGNRRL